MSKGIVYVLTNPAMEGYVKIGKTGNNLEQRLKELDSTSTPLPFQCMFAMEVDDMHKAERLLHDAFADNRTRKNREFFEINPERVASALRLSNGKDVTPTEDVAVDEEGLVALERASKKIRERFRFPYAKINEGEVITYALDEKVEAIVRSEREIEFEGEVMTLSQALIRLAPRYERNPQRDRANGTGLWKYKGENLYDRRKRLEEEAAAAEED